MRIRETTRRKTREELGKRRRACGLEIAKEKELEIRNETEKR
jgi:hypothetical protein